MMRRLFVIAGTILCVVIFYAVMVADLIYSPRDFDLLGGALLVAGLVYVVLDEICIWIVDVGRRISIARFPRKK